MKNNYSKIIAGCMSWGAWGKQFSKQEMTQQIITTLEAGITTFDHADIYGDYTTEGEFGKAFVESGVQRENIQLISKCGIQYVGKSRDNEIKHYNYSKDYIIWSAERSLKELHTDYLDVLLLHRPSPLMNPYEISSAVQQLKEQGKILSFGVSNFTPSQVNLISDDESVSVNQIEFSLSQHTAMHNGSLDQMLQKEITPMCWSPLGTIFKEQSDANFRILELLEVLSEKYEATEDQLLLSWILRHPATIHPVIGTTNSERIQNAVRATKIELELEDWFSLLVACQGHKVP
ncbi:aldo/keto reductase [Flavobacteriaceae bacterium S356]|uniref:Aldo/keto reductase n=1 Tax=Asprobacillus argus TaxID=3076534 RepID=A0ABU3LDP8_9FLAO|nr:aldo/keto reductase [Flavobacteriaceae bacterium S356]